MDSPRPSPVPTTATSAVPNFAGVYMAKPSQLLIGPLTHLEHFFSAPAGAAFGGCCSSDSSGAERENNSRSGTVLPPPSLRYVVDCGPHVSDLPPLPSYAIDTTRQKAPTATLPLSLPAVPSSGAAAAVCPATMSLHPQADENTNGNTSSGSHHSAAPDITTTTTTLSTHAVSPLPENMSTSEVVQRMNRSAVDCLERLRQRCVQNGMSTAVFTAAARRTASTNGALASQASSPSAPLFLSAVDSQSTPEPAQLPTTHDTRETAPTATTATTRTTAAAAGALTTARAELVAQASQNDALAAAAAAKLGPDHVIRCPISTSADSLDAPAVQDAVHRIQAVLQSDPDAMVYIYSLDGKGTASAVAALHLLQVDHVPLSEVLLERLPACTPRMTCLVQLLARDPSPDTFDKNGYLRLYLARRYPSAAASSIEAAVSTCKGNYVKAERLVRQEIAFQRADDGFKPHRNLRGTSSDRVSYAPSLSNISSAPVHSGANVTRGSSGYVDASMSDFSLCSSFIKDPLRLTESDEGVIDSLYKALADGRVGVSRDDVRDSYLQNRRSQDLVLRQFLLRFRSTEKPSGTVNTGSGTVTPTRLYGVSSYSSNHGNFSGNVTPRVDAVVGESIALPHFLGQSASRRGSAVRGSTTPTCVTLVTATATAGETEQTSFDLHSPEPTVPSVRVQRRASARTPGAARQAATAAAEAVTSRAKAGVRELTTTPRRAIATTTTTTATAVQPSPATSAPKKKVKKSTTPTPTAAAKGSPSPKAAGRTSISALKSEASPAPKTPKSKAKAAAKAPVKGGSAAIVV